MQAAFFDLDGTLLTGHMYSHIVRRRFTDLVGAWRASNYILGHMALVPFMWVHLLERTRFFMSWNIDLALLLKSMKVERASPLFQSVAQDMVTTVRQDVLRILRQHQQQGHEVLLVSGTFQPLLQEIGRLLEVPRVVGTALEVRDGRYTGRLASPLVFGEEKARQAQSYVKQAGLDVDLAASYAYADRIHDLPFLMLVGHPIPTYPDRELLAHARKQGWTIVGEPHD